MNAPNSDTIPDLVEHIVDSVRALDDDYRDEFALRDAAAQALRDGGLVVKVATQVARIGRVELMVGSIAVECATVGTARSVQRQVQRVAGSRDVEAVVLLTTQRAHAGVPGVVKGTPVRTVLLVAS